jgi:hypothetical protein
MEQTPSNQHDEANARRRKPKHLQIDPSQRGFCLYEITQGSGVIAAILAVSEEVTIGHIDYQSSTEYWSMNGPPAKLGCSLVNTTLGGADWGTPPELPGGYTMEGATEALDCGTTAAWVVTSSPAAGWYGTNRSGAKVGLSWVGSTITWYISSAVLPASPTYIIASDEASLPLTYHADAPAPGAGQAWYTVSYTLTAAPPSPAPTA